MIPPQQAAWRRLGVVQRQLQQQPRAPPRAGRAQPRSPLLQQLSSAARGDRRTVRVALAGTGFAADYTAKCYGLLPHKNGISIDLSGVASGSLANAERFAEDYNFTAAYATHAEMLAACQPDIANVASANYTHGSFTTEAAAAGVSVIVLEKPPVVWPGYREGRSADARTRRVESMSALAEVLNAVRAGGSRLLYAEDFCYLDGVKGVVELLREAIPLGKGRILLQRGACGHQVRRGHPTGWAAHCLCCSSPNIDWAARRTRRRTFAPKKTS
jgi:hypothetical protein